MNVFGVVVMRDEAHRYLDSALRWLSSIVDAVVVYDDGSRDESKAIALNAGVPVWEGVDAPLFMRDEAACRRYAWEAIGQLLQPTSDDWVLSVDADEFLVSPMDTGEALRVAAVQAERLGRHSVSFPVAEVFGRDGDDLLVRTDGWWGGEHAARMARWPTDLSFPRPRDGSATIGGGSIPAACLPAMRTTDVTLLHVGYLDPVDREAKAARYAGRRGHSRRHVASILQRPSLKPWAGVTPPIIRGSGVRT